MNLPRLRAVPLSLSPSIESWGEARACELRSSPPKRLEILPTCEQAHKINARAAIAAKTSRLAGEETEREKSSRSLPVNWWKCFKSFFPLLPLLPPEAISWFYPPLPSPTPTFLPPPHKLTHTRSPLPGGNNFHTMPLLLEETHVWGMLFLFDHPLLWWHSTTEVCVTSLIGCIKNGQSHPSQTPWTSTEAGNFLPVNKENVYARCLVCS